MKLSARTRYAARILLELGRHDQGKPVPAGRLSERTGVSVQFIEQILKDLKQAGITSSIRGSTGGHMLARPPKDITLGHIVRLMEGGISLTMCSAHEETNCERKDQCLTRAAWIKASRALENELDSINIHDLLGQRAHAPATHGEQCHIAQTLPPASKKNSKKAVIHKKVKK